MGQRDFRQQDEHLLALFQRCRDRLEIDLGLARPGDAFEKRRHEAVLTHRAGKRLGGRFLIVGQIGGFVSRVRCGDDRGRRQFDFLETSRLGQSVDNRKRNASGMSEPRARPGKSVGSHFQHAVARRRHPLRQDVCTSQTRRRWLRIECGRHAQDHARHHARRRQCVARDPVDEAAHVLGHGQAVEDMFDRAQLLRVDLVLLRSIPDDPGDKPRPEWHRDDGTGFDDHAIWHHIGIGPLRRSRHEHGNGIGSEQRILPHYRVTLPISSGKRKPDQER